MFGLKLEESKYGIYTLSNTQASERPRFLEIIILSHSFIHFIHLIRFETVLSLRLYAFSKGREIVIMPKKSRHSDACIGIGETVIFFWPSKSKTKHAG